MTLRTNVREKRNSVSDFLLSVASDRICAKVTAFHFALSMFTKESMEASFQRLKFYPPRTWAPCPQRLQSIGLSWHPSCQETALILLAGVSSCCE